MLEQASQKELQVQINLMKVWFLKETEVRRELVRMMMVRMPRRRKGILKFTLTSR